MLAHQADHEKKSLNTSIPQLSLNLSIEMEPTKNREPIGLDSFPLGTVRSFRLYLKAQRIFLETGIIV